jgi:hypothetical protein
LVERDLTSYSDALSGALAPGFSRVKTAFVNRARVEVVKECFFADF